VAGSLHQSPCSLSALLKCTVFSPMTTQDLLFATVRNAPPQLAIQIVAHVIANPQGEAIHCTRRDCFTAFAMTGEGRGGGQAASIAIFPFHAAEMQHIFPNDDTRPPFCDHPKRAPTIGCHSNYRPRHCERSEAIHYTRMDCFTAFAMTGEGWRAGCMDRHFSIPHC
jgi:hypothetical protein